MLRKIRKSQSIAEYAVLIAIAIGAAIAMQVYVKRGLQAKVKSHTDSFTGITATIDAIPDSGVDSAATISDMPQYEPYYLESSYDRYQENVEQEHLGGGQVIKEKVSVRGYVCVGRTLIPNSLVYSLVFLGILIVELVVLAIHYHVETREFKIFFFLLTLITAAALVLFLIEGLRMRRKIRIRQSDS